MNRLKAFTALNLFSMIILVAVLAMALGGIISWTYFGIFAAGWLTGLTISYRRIFLTHNTCSWYNISQNFGH